MTPSEYRDLGMRAVTPWFAVGLQCDHCKVTWAGCAAECCCPECGAPKDYSGDGRCMCERCQADDALERAAADLWRVENPGKSVFACDQEEKGRYRQRVLSGDRGDDYDYRRDPCNQPENIR